MPYDDGYIYVLGGPYDAREELQNEFPEIREEVIDEAVEAIERDGVEWIKRDQY